MAFSRTYDGDAPVRINKWLGQTGVCSRREAESLKARDPAWGLRDRDAVVAAAKARGLALTRRIEMPANNLMLLFRRV